MYCTSCVCGTLCHIMLLSKHEHRLVFITPWLISHAGQHLCAVPSSDLCPLSTSKCQRAILPGSRIFPLACRMTRIRSGFQRNNNGLHCGFNSCFPLSPKKNRAVRGGTSCFILAPLLLKDLNHSLSLAFERLTPISPSLLSAPVKPLLTGRKVLCSLLGVLNVRCAD